MERTAKLSSYVAGFALSVVLTLVPVALIAIHDRSGHVTFTHPFLREAAVACAVLQLAIQLFFFFPVWREGRHRSAAMAFSLMMLFVGILIGGSLWIMTNLQGRMGMTPAQMQDYMNSQDTM